VFNNLPKGVIEEWFTYSYQWNYFDPDHHINLHSWVHGCPRRAYEQLKKIEKGLTTHYIYTNAKVAPKALIPRNELYFQVEQHSDKEDLQYALNLCNYKYDFDKQILTKIVRIK
jgi:hypothetical protein